MFQFPSSPQRTLCIYARLTGHSLQPGFPIRISADRWLFAPPHSFSQLIASFIGSWCQGIHPVLLVT